MNKSSLAFSFILFAIFSPVPYPYQDASATPMCYDRNIGSAEYPCSSLSSQPIWFVGGTPGISAYDFENQVGMNIHLSNKAYGDSASILNYLKYLNIHHIRDGLSAVPGSSYMQNALNMLGANGISVDLISSRGFVSATISSDISKLNPGVVEALEGPNELDINNDASWILDDQNEQKEIWSYIQSSNPSMISIGPSLGGPGDSYLQLGDMSSVENYGNTHDYEAGYYPENLGYGSEGFCGQLYGSVPYNLCNAKQASLSVPIVATEFGYQVNPSVTNDVQIAAQATYIIRQILAHDSYGSPVSYIYSLFDSGGQTFGLWSGDHLPRIAATEIGQFMQILKDNTKMQSPCSVPASVSTPGVSSAGVCMSNGSYALILWQPVATWNPNSHSWGSFPTISASIDFVPGFIPDSTNQWSYQTNGPWTNSGTSDPRSVPVTDRPSIVMFNSTPVPLPTMPP